jgi:hypothetical protein
MVYTANHHLVRFQPYFRPREHFTILNNQVKKMLDRNRVIEYVAHITVNSDDAVGSMERDCCVIKKVFLVFGEEKPLFLSLCIRSPIHRA